MQQLADRYPILIVWSEDDGAYIATSPDFPGLTGVDADEGQARYELREAIAMALEVMVEEGRTPAPPRVHASHSGQFRLRVAKSVHAALAERAEEEGVSLNQLVSGYISQGLGMASGVETAAQRVDAAAQRLREATIARELAVIADAQVPNQVVMSASSTITGISTSAASVGRGSSTSTTS